MRPSGRDWHRSSPLADLANRPAAQINAPNMDTFKVTIDRETKSISVMNNGRGIPIEIHSKEQIYIPELIFGHLCAPPSFEPPLLSAALTCAFARSPPA